MIETICGIPTKAFKDGPTPEELAAVIAAWNSDDQAMFFIALGEQLRNRCGGNHFMQWQYIADSIKQVEERLCDGSGSQLIDEINQRLAA